MLGGDSPEEVELISQSSQPVSSSEFRSIDASRSFSLVGDAIVMPEGSCEG